MKVYTIILVRDLRTGRIENHELFESTAFSAESLAKEISRRIGEIERKYHIHCYDVYAEGHDSIESIRHDYPELEIFTSTPQDEKTVLLGKNTTKGCASWCGMSSCTWAARHACTIGAS